MRFCSIFLILLFKISPCFAECGSDCPLMSQVQLTQKGTERLFEIILKGTFDHIQKTVETVAGFKDLALDQSDCPKMKLYQVMTKKPKCLGVMDFRKHVSTIPDSETELTPFRADLKNMALQKLNIELVTPVKCENWKCRFIVQAKDLKIAGNLSAQYSDTGEPVFPKANIELDSVPDAKLFYEISLEIDPDSGQMVSMDSTGYKAESDLNRLVKVVPSSSDVTIKPGNLGVSLSFPETNSTASKADVFKIQYDRYLKLLSDPKWIQEEYRKKKMNPFRYKGTPNVDDKDLQERVTKATADWAKKNDPFNNETAFRNMPKDLVDLVDSAGDQDYIAEATFQATKKGFTNFASYSTLRNIERLANQALNDNNLILEQIRPFVVKEIGPIVEGITQNTLRDSNIYWNLLSKVPLGSDSLTLDTEFVIEEFDRIQNVLKLNLYDTNSNCVVPKNKRSPSEQSNPAANDFDMATSIPAASFERILQKAFVEKKLTDCKLARKPDCKDGSLFTINKMPKIICDENGEMILDLPDNDIRIMQLFNVKEKSKIKIDVQNCNGSPCARFYNNGSELVNLPFNGFLNRGIEKQFEDLGRVNLPIPFFKLKDLKKDKKCNFDFQWNLDYQKK